MKHKYKVLIADEDEEILSLLSKNLEQETYMVETTQSASYALEKIMKDKYHIILIDMDLSDMNGIELLKEIKAFDAMAQVIMMAGYSTMDKILNSLEHGANDYIQKPFSSMEHVIEVVNYSVEKLERWRKAIIEIIK